MKLQAIETRIPCVRHGAGGCGQKVTSCGLAGSLDEASTQDHGSEKYEQQHYLHNLVPSIVLARYEQSRVECVVNIRIVH